MYKDENLPENMKECQQSFKTNHSDWEYIYWTDDEIEKFIKKEYNWFYPIYISYQYNIQRIDSSRYFILYHYGGVYADLDFLFIKNIDRFLEY